MAGVKRFQAEVTSIKDPERRGRIKVRCESLLDRDAEAGETEAPELPDWLEPMFQTAGNPDRNGGRAYGHFFVPRVGDIVEIFVDEDAGIETEDGLRWLCAVYPNAAALPLVFKGEAADLAGWGTPDELYPLIQGYISPLGSGWLVADLPDKDGKTYSFMSLFHRAGSSGPWHVITMGAQNGFSGPVIFLADGRLNSISIEYDEDRITVQTTDGHRIMLQPDGIEVEHSSGAKLSVQQTFIEVLSGGGEAVKIDDAGGITIGTGATEPLVLGTSFTNLLLLALGEILNHTHAGGAIPSMDPPFSSNLAAVINTLALNVHLSDLAKTKK